MLYKAAVCDDCEKERQRIVGYLQKFSIEFDVEFKVDCFSDGSELIKDYKQSGMYDLLFLDMEMEHLGGLETAEQIRRIPDRNVLIVFVTSYPEYMQDSFDVQASQYLLKNLSYEVFCEKLQKLLHYLQTLETNIKVVSMRGEETILYLEKIVSLETLKSPTRKSQLLVTATDGEFQIKGKIAEFEKELKKQFFISVHRSVLVNMRYIRKINAQSLVLTTGKTMEVSRRRLSQIKEAYTNYMMMRYTK